MKVKVFLSLSVLALLCCATDDSMAATVLYFESSPSSWVGHGMTLHVTDQDGYSFTAKRNYDNGVNFSISSETPHDHWHLNLAAPFEETIAPGLYEDAARFPFQDYDQPGLTFYGNHRGNNQNAGFFEVFEAVYTPTGAVERFAVDFTQYGEGNPDRWINGMVRYNSDVPIPEPTTVFLLAFGSLELLRRKRRP